MLSAVKLDDQITLLKVTEVDPVTQKEMDEQAMKVGLKPVDHIDVVYHEHSFDLISHDEGYTFILTVGVKEDSPVEATNITMNISLKTSIHWVSPSNWIMMFLQYSFSAR